ncbi:MAG: GerAB/ArcD/ProY family transporter, partial [Corallococcus sp.]|nr:GerAB/ArcD/ProY family transporter [Corallococcus sp.]
MDRNRVSVDQLALLYLLMIAGGKFLAFPSILAKDVGHDSWIVLCFSFLWDAICLCFVLWAIKINKAKQLDIGTILNKSVSKVVSKIIFAIFFVIFVARTIILLSSCYKTFSVTFDVKTNWIFFILPVIGVSMLVIRLGFNSIARASQIFMAIIILAVVALMISSLSQTEFSSLLPIGEAGWGKIIETSYTRSFWFSDYIFIYFVFDSIKVKKRIFSPVMTAFAVGAALTIFMNAVFVAMYGSLAPSFDLAMSKIGIFSLASTTNGRWDWLTLSVWLVSVFIKIVVFIFCAYKCAEKIFEIPSTKPNWFVGAFISILLLLPMFISVDFLLNDFIKWCL